MTWDDLGHLAERGLRIGSHSRTHPHLSRLSPAQLDDELGGCCEDLRSRLGLRSTQVAYPYGAVNAGVTACAAKWFSHGVTTEMAPLAATSQPMMLPRLDLYYYRGTRGLQEWGSIGFTVRLNLIAWRRRLKAALTSPPAR